MITDDQETMIQAKMLTKDFLTIYHSTTVKCILLKKRNSYKDYDEASVNNEANYEPDVVENETIDMTKSSWGEIEDDTVNIKTTKIKILGQWNASHGKDRLMNQNCKEIRKANDGPDVFSGTEEYRNEISTKEQTDEHDAHKNQYGPQKQSLRMLAHFRLLLELLCGHGEESVNIRGELSANGCYEDGMEGCGEENTVGTSEDTASIEGQQSQNNYDN